MDTSAVAREHCLSDETGDQRNKCVLMLWGRVQSSPPIEPPLQAMCMYVQVIKRNIKGVNKRDMVRCGNMKNNEVAPDISLLKQSVK